MQNLKNSGFKFSKSLGQNFLLDEGLLSSIVNDLGLTATDTIIEIGTGAGTLTRVLAQATKRVITFEVDRRLESVLSEQFKDCENIELKFADGLKTKEEEIERFANGEFKLVANIPYYITTPLLMKFINIPQCKSISVLVQDEVARRIVAKSGNKEYGALSVTMQTYADCKIVRKVPRGSFVPAPNVDSIFIQCNIKNTEVANRDVFDKLVKGLFGTRRKTVLNGLSIVFGLTKENATKLLNDVGINETKRPEELSSREYVELANVISSFLQAE